MRKINIGLVGAGVVGSSFVNQLHEKHQRIIDEFEIDFRIPKILVRDTSSKRDVPSTSILFSQNEDPSNFSDVVTSEIDKLFEEQNIDLIVEVAGGTTQAYEIIKTALNNGIPTITANKALLAERGKELYQLANEKHVDLLFEAAVAGGVPLIRPLRESLAVEKINSVKAILNGTTNFMLSQMTKNGVSYQEALGQAQKLGYAEADPTADVQGEDAAAKIAIISLLATGTNAYQDDVECIGITEVTTHDILAAQQLGYVIKLIATVQDKNADEVFLRVEPTFVPATHPFSTVHDGFNAAFVSGEKLGEVMFYGPGAGGDATASAVLGDVMDGAINIVHNRKGAVVGFEFDRKVANPRDWTSSFFISIDVLDEPGVLAQIAEVFGKHKVSLATVHQDLQDAGAHIVFLTHEASVGNLEDAALNLENLTCVRSKPKIYPIL